MQTDTEQISRLRVARAAALVAGIEGTPLMPAVAKVKRLKPAQVEEILQAGRDERPDRIPAILHRALFRR
jgi:hypothetical protein